MSKRIIKPLCIIMAVFLLFSSLFSVSCMAVVTKNLTVDVSVYKEEGDDGVITVDISLPQNPGVGAFTFSLLYDNTAFSVSKYYSGKYYYSAIDDFIIKNGYLINDLHEQSMVKFVWNCDPGNVSGTTPDLFTGTGVMFRLKFAVNTNQSGKYPFEIGNINPVLYGKDLSGCFADFDHNVFNATASNDAYVIGNNTNISPTYPWAPHESEDKPSDDPVPSTHTHNYLLHKTVSPSCEADGYSTYDCTICGDKQKKDIKPALGHDFNDYWTVDRISSDSVAMKVSRHCSRCGAVKDVYYFSSEQVKEYGIQNKLDAKIKIGGEIAEKTGMKTTADSDTSTIEKENNKNKDYSKNKNKVENAEELIESAKDDAIKKEKGTSGKVKRAYNIFSKIYMYLIGTKEKPGVLTVIVKAIIKWFK